MKILLTGVTGYIGKRLLPVLLKDGHEVICVVRDKNRLDATLFSETNLKIIEADFLDYTTLDNIPDDIDGAYYLLHSMSSSTAHFEDLEKTCAINFNRRLSKTAVKQVIYLSGIVNARELSAHLQSRKMVEGHLASSSYQLTTLRAGIIVGSGSASFEIIRDLVEKLPVMIAPRWLNTLSQPIAIRNVIQFLQGVLLLESTFNKSFDLGGHETLSYKQMLLQFAEVRGLKRTIWTVPVMTPKLSSYWLYLVTSTTYSLAVNLVDSMKVEVVGKPNPLADRLKIELLPYKEAVRIAFGKIEQQDVISSWTDAATGNKTEKGLHHFINIPVFGCLRDAQVFELKDESRALDKIWSIGGQTGWYYGTWLWELRGFVDKLSGGVGLRRGRKNPSSINAGESLDFWRVLYASKKEKRLLLYAEMKLPGEAWLEFSIKDNRLHQTATFRPTGLWGRLYWFSLLPFHWFIFKGMARRISE
jgi:uncharacterized protein YbjT (DUF2867 family)